MKQKMFNLKLTKKSTKYGDPTMSSNSDDQNAVYKVIFDPCIFALLHLQKVSPRLKFA